MIQSRRSCETATNIEQVFSKGSLGEGKGEGRRRGEGDREGWGGGIAMVDITILKRALGSSLAVWCLRLPASTTGGSGSIPSRGTKIPHALRCSQINILPRAKCRCRWVHRAYTMNIYTYICIKILWRENSLAVQ